MVNQMMKETSEIQERIICFRPDKNGLCLQLFFSGKSISVMCQGHIHRSTYTCSNQLFTAGILGDGDQESSVEMMNPRGYCSHCRLFRMSGRLGPEKSDIQSARLLNAPFNYSGGS